MERTRHPSPLNGARNGEGLRGKIGSATLDLRVPLGFKESFFGWIEDVSCAKLFSAPLHPHRSFQRSCLNFAAMKAPRHTETGSPPRIVIALDAFKGGLSAEAACRAVAEGLRKTLPGATCILKPMADGGEGTAAALLASRPGGEWISRRVAGPLPEHRVDAGFAWFPGEATAVVEMAAAGGLPLVPEARRNPLIATTRGVGELVRAAAIQGARTLYLTLGGSATVDGGTGAATALGWKFLDRRGNLLPGDGGHLRDIARILPPEKDAAWSSGKALPSLTVLCDVTNPLCGPKGAAQVFAPQKGATPAMVAILEEGLENLAERLREDLGREVRNLPGAGAAGGLGAGAVAFLDAELSPGIATILAVSGMENALSGADACITGEGAFDESSLGGKVVCGVAEAARAAGVPVVVFAGQVRVAPSRWRAHEIHEVLATHAPDMPMREVLRREAELLRETAARWMRQCVRSGLESPETPSPSP